MSEENHIVPDSMALWTFIVAQRAALPRPLHRQHGSLDNIYTLSTQHVFHCGTEGDTGLSSAQTAWLSEQHIHSTHSICFIVCDTACSSIVAQRAAWGRPLH